METFLGLNNTFTSYIPVLLLYYLLFLFIRYPKPSIELNYRSTFMVLAILWPLLMVSGNYFGFLAGMMSFLPWFDNIIHSFIWIGLCLTWLYYSSRHRPMWEQFIFFSVISFLVKVMENKLIGTWEMDHFLMFHGTYAYIIAMSLIDGFYPVVSKIVVKLVAKNPKWGVME